MVMTAVDFFEPRLQRMARFRNLFEGGHQAHGKVWGESVKGPAFSDTWLDHLGGERDEHSLGIYTVRRRDDLHPDDQVQCEALEESYGTALGDAWVRWGCTDIDIGFEEGWDDAVALRQALSLMRIPSFIEKTKGKGYHVWVFADTWVPALVMRRALLAAHQVADVKVDEVNPKQVNLTSTRQGLGNYVNLPYFYGAEPGRRAVVDFRRLESERLPDEYAMYALDEFLDEAYANRVDVGTLVSAGRLYVEPPPKKAVTIHSPYEGNLRELTKRLTGLAFTIFRDGPKEGMDRSDKLCQLAYYCHDAGLTPDEAYAVVADADTRWGKFFPEGRVDAEEQLLAIITNAYG